MRMVYVSSGTDGTIGGMRGREKTSDECIPRPARMRREHRAGGKGEAKDDGVRRRTEGGPGGGKVGNPALPLHKDKRRRRRRKGGGGAAAGMPREAVCRPSACSVLRFSSHPRASTCFSSPRSPPSPSLSPALSRVPPPSFLFVAYHRLLAAKKNSHHRRKTYFDGREPPLRRRSFSARYKTRREKKRFFQFEEVPRENGLMFNTGGSKGIFQDLRSTKYRFGEYFWIGYDSRFGYKLRESLSWRNFYFFPSTSSWVGEKRRRFVGVVKSGLVKGGVFALARGWLAFPPTASAVERKNLGIFLSFLSFFFFLFLPFFLSYYSFDRSPGTREISF